MIRLAIVRIAVFCATFVTACGSSAKRETAALSAAVDRYRRADNSSKAAEAQIVAGVACTGEKVCGAKAACVAAIDPTTRALQLKDEVTRRLGDLQNKRLSPESPEAEALPAKLDEATRLLGEGRAKMAICDKQLTDLEVASGR